MNHRIDPCFKVNPINIKYDINNQLHGFTMLMMLSNNALSYLLDIYKQGNYGFVETFFPSVLYYNTYKGKPFKLGSFNDYGFVDGYSQDDNSTMNCKAYSKEEYLKFKKNKLYHAIKDENIN